MLQHFVATELIVRDLATSTAFYHDILGLPLEDSGPGWAMFKIGEVFLFLLEASNAVEMMSAEPLDFPAEGNNRLLLAVIVDDVDALYADLGAKGVRLLRPPADQEWGLRTAYFADPDGNFWEIHQPVK